MYIFELFTCIIPNVSKKSKNPDESHFPQVNSAFYMVICHYFGKKEESASAFTLINRIEDKSTF